MSNPWAKRADPLKSDGANSSSTLINKTSNALAAVGDASGGHPSRLRTDAGPPATMPPPSAVSSIAASGKGSSGSMTGLVSAVRSTSSSSSILVNPCQKGNPCLTHVRSTPYSFDATILSDFQLGLTCGALFLSLRYQRLHPEYISGRMDQLTGRYDSRLLLVLVDVAEHKDAVRELSILAIQHEFTMILAWSGQEVALYLEQFKGSENKPADSIRERTTTEYMPTLTDFLTQIKGVNKTDVVTLASTFGSLHHLINNVSAEELGLCPGIGPSKVKRILQAFNEDFC